jgi:hypothetical protein
MMIKLLMILTIVVIPSVSFGNDICTKGSEFEPPLCPLKLQRISTIQIEKNGIRTWISPEQHIDCSEFKLDAQKVRKFFSRAKVTDERAAHYTLASSLCETSGTLTFADGKKAHWQIGHLREGWLVIGSNDGLLLYCPACKFKPFVY